MDDSRCGMAETNTTWESNYPPFKNKKQKQENRKRATTKIEQSRPQPEHLLWQDLPCISLLFCFIF